MTESSTSQPRTDVRNERTRLTALSGALIVVAAVVGAESLVSAASPMGLADRGAVVAVRSFSVTRATGIESATGLGWTAVALLAVLLVRCVTMSSLRVERAPIRLRSPRLESLLSNGRRKRSISTRSGGLYGP